MHRRQQPSVVVVVVNWNRAQDTIACLRSLASVTHPECSTLVVDNGSDDGSAQLVREAGLAAEVLVNPANLGFAAGANVGIRRALQLGADYVLLLNNDTTADSGFLQPLVAACQDGSGVGIAGPSAFYTGDEFYSSGGWPRRLLPLLVKQARPPEGLESASWSSLAPVELGYLWGQAMLVRSQVFERIGLFDEGFFMYYEDCDFCRRASRAGFRLLWVPGSHVWHKVAQSTQGNEWLRWRYKIASMQRFHRKYARWGAVQASAQTVLTIAGIALREIARGNLRWLAYPTAELTRRRRKGGSPR
jgi:GT2 family glycosyltransferase